MRDNQGDMFNNGDAKLSRDEALERVRRHGGDWQEKALAGLMLLSGFIGTSEDVRIKLIVLGLEKPHHHNAWGAFAKEALKRKLYIPTGQRRHMRGDKSNARKTDVYRVA